LDVAATWERISAHHINRIVGRKGRLWAKDSYDHIVRNEEELKRIDAYVRRNPEKANLGKAFLFLAGVSKTGDSCRVEVSPRGSRALLR